MVVEVVTKDTANLPGSCAGVVGRSCGGPLESTGSGGPLESVVGKQTKLGTFVVVVAVVVVGSKPHSSNKRVVETMDPMVE